MNIFKTLASGSGSINEPNVSAFLGYLLNPKEDHGLGDAFLKKFLEPLLGNDDLGFMKDRNLSIHSNFEFEVLLEQAFRDDKDDKDKNNKGIQIVDIVILCYEKKAQQGRFLAEDIIKQKNEGVGNPKHIFLIENKINDGSSTEGQLKEQYKQTIEKLIGLNIVDPQKLVSVIFVTPDGKKCKNEFSEFKNTANKIHLFWNIKSNDSTQTKNDIYVSEIIREIIEKESKPIDAYCKYTLKAFLEFIENDFKSTIEEESESKGLLFEYKGEPYTRPKLAEKIIMDYIKNNPKITFDKLRNYFSDIFPKKETEKNCPFVKKEDAWKADYRDYRDVATKIYDHFGYYDNPIKIVDAEICVANGWSDEKKLQKLLDKTNKGLKLDEIRITK